MVYRAKLVVVVLGCLFLSELPASYAQENDLDKLLHGEWKVASRVIKGKTDNPFIGGTLSLLETERSEVKLINGVSINLKFSRKIHDEKSKTFRFTIETPDDAQGMGGGGPRKGICKINEKGELEIVETRSASYDFPIDFSDATKAAAIYWKLTKNPESKK